MIGRIKEKLENSRVKVERWFQGKFEDCPEPLYTSVDIRNSHHKIAVVDTNAFPAGFNNLCPKYCESLVSSFKEYIHLHHEGVGNILLYPERHTRNKFYLENVWRLHAALSQAGFDVRVGTDDPELRQDCITFQTDSGELEYCKVKRDDDRVVIPDFTADIVIANNDFTNGVPGFLEGLSIPVVPSPGLGWHRRRKSDHFSLLNQLTEEFGEVTGIDPWLMSTHISRSSDVDFKDDQLRERLAAEVDETVSRIRTEYEQRGIDDEPLVFIKHDAGTYGIAMMTARSGDDVRQATHKTKTKMKTGKGRIRVTEVMIQEGIPTRDSMGGFPMEPVIYMVGRTPVGGFYRLHRERSEIENLNVRGMEFRRLCFHQVAEKHPESLDDRCEDAASLLMVYGTLARLAVLALGMEMRRLETKD